MLAPIYSLTSKLTLKFIKTRKMIYKRTWGTRTISKWEQAKIIVLLKILHIKPVGKTG
jgi:hypothetical protein